MKSTGKNIYPWAFGTSFLILTVLIGFLIFNTYKLEDNTAGEAAVSELSPRIRYVL